MTKSRKVSSGIGQMSIFDYVKQKEEESKAQMIFPTRPQGSMDIAVELCAAITEDLKAANDNGRALSRYEVSARMSELVGQEITATMLYNYSSESHDRHRFPAEWLPAFVIATGGQRRTFECLSRHAGLFALPGRDALRAEMQKLDEEERRIKNQKQKHRMLIAEIEKNGR
jgi:hypothetical protein